MGRRTGYHNSFTIKGSNQTVSDERFTASATFVGLLRQNIVPGSEPNIDTLETLSLDALDLPDEAGPLAIREPPQGTPEGIQLRVGSRRRLESVLGDLADRVQTVSRRT